MKKNTEESTGKPEKGSSGAEGHRDRRKQIFLRLGLDAFLDYEVLEFLLFFSVPRRDTKPQAKELIRQFGSLSGVFDADMEKLKQIKGIGESSAILLHMIPMLSKLYQLDRMKRGIRFETTGEIGNYLEKCFIGAKKETTVVLYLTRQMVLQSTATTEGLPDLSSPYWLRSLVDGLSRSGSDVVVLAHNHPDASSAPSDADMFATQELSQILSRMGSVLFEHFIISENGARPLLNRADESLLQLKKSPGKGAERL